VGNIGLTEFLIIIFLIILIFGSRRLPDLFKALGTSLRQFKKGIQGDDSDQPPKP
jgi:sec-independent protein translocase protein TatA